MPSVYACPISVKPQFELADGLPAVGNKLFFYVAGSSTKLDTYTTSAGSVANANPVVLNSLGFPTDEIWLQGLAYKIVYAPSTDTDPPTSAIWSIDNLRGINDPAAAGVVDQWVASGLTPTFVSATSFTLVGDQTVAFHVGRRLKTTNSGGTFYSTITASTFGAVTTVTVVNDSFSLDAGLSAVSYGLLTATQQSTPGYLVLVGEPTAALQAVPARDLLGHISGLIYLNDTVDATNDLVIGAGVALDDSEEFVMRLAASLTKQSDVVWAAGTNSGMLDTGAVGNSDYYLWLIGRPSTGVIDVLSSLSSTAPTMPANYNYKRLIGWFKRSGGAILAFHAYERTGGGLEFAWDAPILDVDSTVTTSRRTDPVSVPLGFTTIANVSVYAFDATTGFTLNVCCPDQTDAAPSVTASPGGLIIAPANEAQFARINVRTSATGTVSARATLASVDNYRVFTNGFEWSRR